MWMHKQKRALTFIMAFVIFGVPAPIAAQTSSSPNFQVNETFFGTGGELDASSDNFRSRQSAGELTVGYTEGNLFNAYAGFNTTEDPFIEFVVTNNNIDLGFLDTDEARTANGTFYVRAWQASGYVVTTESDPPTNNAGPGSQISPLASPTASTAGTEQFGMNLVANTSPVAFGAQPQQSTDFSFGQVATDYATPNVFKYQKGDVIASSLESTSVTIFTLSYIFNIDESTPSGLYTFTHTLVATGTY